MVFGHWHLNNIMGLVFQGTLAPKKQFNCCFNIYGSQKYALLLHNFANNVAHVHLQMIALKMPTEHCNHCQYHLHNSIHTPLTLSLTYLLHRASTVSSPAVDHLTKLMHLIPCTMWEDKLSAAQVAKFLFENIVRFFWSAKRACL